MGLRDRERFAMAINVLATAFERELDEPLLEAYWMALDDLPIDVIERAVKRSIRELEYFPKPAQLRKLEAPMKAEHRAVVAWRVVSKTAASTGAYASVSFDDPVTNATIRNMGGWHWLCERPAKDFDVWVRKDFERIYRALYESGVNGDSCKHLPGRTERDNIGSGPEVVTVSVGLPAPQLKLLGESSGPGKTHHLGQASVAEERQEDRSFGRQDLHRFIQKSFVVED